MWKEGVGTEQKNLNQSTWISRRTVRFYSSFLTILPLFLCWSVQRGGGQRGERGSLSLRPESLAVFSARGPGSVCQGKFIVKAGVPTHIHTSSLRTQTCVSLPLSVFRLATKSSATESVGAENHYGNQHRGPGCGYSWIGAETFFGIQSAPRSIIEFLLLNVLPGLAGDLCVSFSFILKKRQILKNNQTKNCGYEI